MESGSAHVAILASSSLLAAGAAGRNVRVVRLLAVGHGDGSVVGVRGGLVECDGVVDEFPGCGGGDGGGGWLGLRKAALGSCCRWAGARFSKTALCQV